MKLLVDCLMIAWLFSGFGMIGCGFYLVHPSLPLLWFGFISLIAAFGMIRHKGSTQ